MSRSSKVGRGTKLKNLFWLSFDAIEELITPTEQKRLFHYKLGQCNSAMSHKPAGPLLHEAERPPSLSEGLIGASSHSQRREKQDDEERNSLVLWST